MEDKSSLEIRNIQELLDMRFFIPSYQRGYRWTIQQVKDLLEDIEEFCEKGAKGIYCLQPLVIKNNGDMWEVIDGQQRLTTINIILSCLNKSKFELLYQTRDKSSEFLENILNKSEEDAKDNIDFYHMLKARDYVLNWIKRIQNKKSQAESFLHFFIDVLLTKVKFIWYNTDTQDPIAVFTRLNIDKIPLTSAELIKAILLNRYNFGNEENYERTRLFQQELASQWEQIESMLQNDEFWLFFHDDISTFETRIDYIFELICEYKCLGELSEDIGTDKSYVFRYFYNYFHQHKYNQQTLKHVWGEVKRIYDTLIEWYTHLELYHYVGYLLSRPKESTRKKGNKATQYRLLFNLLQKWGEKGMTIGKFKTYLIGQINDSLSECADLNKIYETNGNPKTQCRPLLLLHNIETIIQQGQIYQDYYKQSVFYRFPFNLYKKEKWDVEHIDSNTANELIDFEDQKEWLLSTYVIASHNQREAIQSFCQSMQDEDEQQERKNKFDALAKDILPYTNEEEYLSEDEKNTIKNFTLLDENTNRSYGNAIFPAKRRIIIGKEQGQYYPTPTFNKDKGFVISKEHNTKSAFIPPCTKQAFMKYYSLTSGNMVAWTKHDAEAYEQNIFDILSKKFNIKR